MKLSLSTSENIFNNFRNRPIDIFVLQGCGYLVHMEITLTNGEISTT